MRTLLSAILAYVSAFAMPRHHLALEAVALRQQLAVYKRKKSRPKLRRADRLFWVLLRQVWKSWSQALILVKPDTVVSVLSSWAEICPTVEVPDSGDFTFES